MPAGRTERDIKLDRARRPEDLDALIGLTRNIDSDAHRADSGDRPN
jgi:hypothetical protein